MTSVELREVRVFLVLANELHFGRTAEQLGLTQSRVSQIVRALERKLGGQLLHRTSRHVALTPLGERLLTELGPAYEHLIGVLERSRESNRRIDGVLRLGVFYVAGGPHLAKIIDSFETRYPGCELQFSELPFLDPLAPLRGGEVDAVALRLPVDRSDITIGPILSREPRVLAISRHHPLATRTSVSIEDVADYAVAPLDVPDELIDEFIPRHTPRGRPIRRLRRSRSRYEVVALIARGRIVHPTVPSFVEQAGQRDIVYVPITDMKPSQTALAWRRGASDPRVRAFVQVAREVLGSTRGTTPPN